MVSPLPDRLGLQKNGTRAHVIYRRSLDDLGKALNLEKRSANWCGVEGSSFLLIELSLIHLVLLLHGYVIAQIPKRRQFNRP